MQPKKTTTTKMENVEILLQAKKINFLSTEDRAKFLRKLKIVVLPVGTSMYVDPIEFEESFNLYFERQRRIRRQRSENGKKVAAQKKLKQQESAVQS